MPSSWTGVPRDFTPATWTREHGLPGGGRTPDQSDYALLLHLRRARRARRKRRAAGWECGRRCAAAERGTGGGGQERQAGGEGAGAGAGRRGCGRRAYAPVTLSDSTSAAWHGSPGGTHRRHGLSAPPPPQDFAPATWTREHGRLGGGRTPDLSGHALLLLVRCARRARCEPGGGCGRRCAAAEPGPGDRGGGKGRAGRARARARGGGVGAGAPMLMSRTLRQLHGSEGPLIFIVFSPAHLVSHLRKYS